MATSLYNLFQEYKIVIPIIQRDYAQGREIGKIPKIRERFLNALFTALKEAKDPLELDFVYGYTTENSNNSGKVLKKFIPLDGQQRLTTLFLLHWYIAVKENHLEEAKQILANFTYETRHSSRVFCDKLVQFVPEELNTPIKETIINQPWFFIAWKNDPTISSMLTMLNAIQAKVNSYDLQNLWSLLTVGQHKIVFHLLPMNKLGLPDDLYIKMNSRGKELTEFEYFKSQFSEILPKEYFDEFNIKIDQSWSDLFWNLYKESFKLTEQILNKFLAEAIPQDIIDRMKSLINQNFTTEDEFIKALEKNIAKDEIVKYKSQILKDAEESGLVDIAKMVDNGFMRFFKYITAILIFKNSIDIESLKDEFDIYKLVYAENEHVKFLFYSLDNLFSKLSTNPKFFDDLFYINENDFDVNKTRLFFQSPKIDLLKKCADCYDVSQRINPFSIGEQLLLYACIEYLNNKTKDFNSRIRKIRNLISNSDDTVRKENMQSLLKTVSEIILNNHIDDSSKFNKKQIDEEIDKQSFIEKNHTLKETICRIEDYHLFQGCIAIFNLDTQLPDYSKAFIEIFKSDDYDTISRALLCFGDYSKKDTWRKRFGNQNDSVWRELLTPSQRRGDFQQTKLVLYSLLNYLIQNPQSNLKHIISEYLDNFDKQSDKPKDWKYYFINYSEFRCSIHGFYYWLDEKNKPYEFIMMRRTTLGGFHWSPFLYTLKAKLGDQVNLENYGKPILLAKGGATLKLSNINKGFKIEAYDDNDSKNMFAKIQELNIVDSNGTYIIKQNNDGVDIEDRVVKGSDLIKIILNQNS